MQTRFGKTACAFGVLMLSVACTSSEGLPRSTGTGGGASTGGALATGGALGTGGMGTGGMGAGGARTGGAPNSGGRGSTGGTSASGGATSAGGTSGTLSCGGTAVLRCAASQWCEMPASTCEADDVMGICTTAGSGACPAIWAPVCGCNNRTYGSDCERRFAKVSKRSDGECSSVIDAAAPDAPTSEAGSVGKTCGTIAGLPCAAGEFCQFPTNTCRVSDNAGVCDVVPSACTKEIAPVCGCDNTTYDNDCLRRMSKVQKRANGACPADAAADATKPTTASEGSVCGYGASTDCKLGLYCNFQDGSCGAGNTSGTCTRPMSGACAAVYEPVCGCDNKTYGNGCNRSIAGVSMKHAGECR